MASNAAAVSMNLTQSDLYQKLELLREKQKKVDAKWKQAGDRNLLAGFVELVPLALNVQRCSIFILDPKTSNAWLQCGTGLKENAIRVSVDGSIVGETISAARPIVADDLNDRMGVHYEVSLRTGFEPRDTLCVPIINSSSKKVIGAIQVLNKINPQLGGDPYTAKDIELLQKVAYNIQATIDNIYLRQEFSKISKAMMQQIQKLEDKLGML